MEVKRKYKYYTFLPQMFDNENTFAETKKAYDLAQNNIDRIRTWYNKNKYFADVSYSIKPLNNKKYIQVKCPKNIDITISSLTDIDRDGNYLLDWHFISP